MVAGLIFQLLSYLEDINKQEEIERKEREWVRYMQEYAMSDDPEINQLEAEKALCIFLKSLGHDKIVKQYEKSMNQAST